MSLVLKQVRSCDGACCRESPRFPNADGTDCIYRKLIDGKENGGCSLITGENLVPIEPSPTQPDKSGTETFQKTCVEWPQNSPVGRGTGGCCWQWVDNGLSKRGD